MSDVFRTMIVPAANAPLARAIANMFAGSDQHMWQVGLSADGAEPATHYISTGAVPDGYQVMAPCQTWEWQQPDPEQPGQWVMTASYPGQPDVVYAACQRPKPQPEPENPDDPPPPDEPMVPCTLQEVEDLFTASDMTEQEPFTAMGRLGLQIIQGSMDAEQVP